MADYTFLQYETFDDGAIVRILLDRPGARNAQNRGLLFELDEAFLHAEADDPCRVVIVGGTGPLFSSGHDTGSKVAIEDYQTHTTSHVRVGYTMLEATDVEAQLLKGDLQGFDIANRRAGRWWRPTAASFP